jgi:hypothetical protein
MQSHSFLLILLLSAAGAVSGQQLLAIPKKNLDSIQAKAGLAGSTLSHTTVNGKVYIMPFDHMRCFVPDMKKVAPMVVIKPPAPEIMPNGIRPISRKQKAPVQ